MKKIAIIMIIIVFSAGILSGCTNQQQTLKNQNKIPNVTCSANPTTGQAPLTVNFVGLASDSDGTITSYYWDFKDGGTSTEQNPIYIFQSSGVYTVTLTVRDDKGGQQSTDIVITVSEGKLNQNPKCSLTADIKSGEAPLIVTFSMTASDDDGFISSWKLDINNDGSPEYSESGNPPMTKQYTYTKTGTYTAKLTVYDNSSGTAFASVTITVTAPPPVKILSHSSYYKSGYFYVVGEVQNLGSSNVKFIKIIATFYNSNNEMIGSDYTYTAIDILIPNQKSPFELNSYPDIITNVDHYEMTLQYRETSESPYNQVTLLSDKSSIENDYYKIIGEVQNIGSSTIKYVKIVATFYNSVGTVVGFDYTYTDLDELSPGQKSPFKLSSYPRKASEMSMDYYALEIQARIA